MVRVMYVLGGGGHTAELVSLMKDLPPQEIVICRDDVLSRSRCPARARMYHAFSLRRMGDSGYSILLRLVPAFVSALYILVCTRAKVIVTTGPAIAIPFMVLGRIMGKRIVYIETISRVASRSSTGRFFGRFADFFFVQWPEMKRLYPGAVYAGRLL